MATLAEQIRALYGNRGDWNYGGIDRAAELAGLLQRQGITDVSQIQLLKNTRQDMQSVGGESDGATTLVETPINQVLFGDKRIGFAGDYNNDNTFGSNASEYLQGDNTLGWSARGDGNVTYKVGTDEQGNNYLMPEWGSSSDMADVRAMAKAAAVMAAMAYGLPVAGGETAAAAGAGEAAGGSGLLSSGAKLSSAPLSTTLAAPAAELVAPSAISGGGVTAGGLLTGTGAPAVLSEAAISTLPAMPAATAAQTFRPSQNYGEGMTGAQTSAYDGVISATNSPALANAAANVAGAGSNVMEFLQANPTLGRLLFSGAGALLNTVGGSSGSSPNGYVDSGYRPIISREGWNAAPQARQMAAQPTGLLMSPGQGQANSGLWRYAGLLDGAAGPSAQAMTPPTTPVMTPPRVTPPAIRTNPPATVRPTITPAQTATAPSVASPATALANTSTSSSAAPRFPSWVFNELRPLEKAALYNSYAQRNTPDAEIRALAGTQQDADWKVLRDLASTLPIDLVKPFPTKTDIQTAVGDWQNRGQQTAATRQPAAPVEASVGVPYVSPAEKFKAHIYQGGANDDEATRRGLGYARLMGWSPEEAVSTWNQALGTKFNTDDYQRALQAYGFTSGGLLGG